MKVSVDRERDTGTCTYGTQEPTTVRTRHLGDSGFVSGESQITPKDVYCI